MKKKSWLHSKMNGWGGEGMGWEFSWKPHEERELASLQDEGWGGVGLTETT